MHCYKKIIAVILVIGIFSNIIEAGPLQRMIQPKRPMPLQTPQRRTPYKNKEWTVARGFGKRDMTPLITHQDYLDSSSKQIIEKLDKIFEDQPSLPTEWLAKEMSNNPVLLQNILQKFVDTNHNGLISAQELLATSTESNEDF